jgi:uncharacterized protein (DUF1501 family)
MSASFKGARREALGIMSAAAVGGLAAGRPSRARAAVASSASGARSKLVVVMLRGAVDGLSVVVPHADPEYRRHRAEILIPAPGATDGALPLDDFFGLHPALAAMMPWWQDGRLAFVQASGSHDSSRSHFDAQDHMETGTPGRRSTPEGWMNRLVGVMGADAAGNPVRGVNLGTAMPRILTGAAQVAALPLSSSERASPTSSAAQARALEQLFANDAVTGPSWAALRQTRQAMLDANTPESTSKGMDGGIAPGAVPLAGLAQEAARLGRLLRREPSMRAGFLSVGGWDTHNAQGGVRGELANRLRGLANGLDALARSLDDQLDDTVIVVMSEFGRTVRQNGTRGTDHGHGNVMWLLGGPVMGGRVAGRWPGLDSAALYEGRDLAVTTDFRQVIAQVLERHLKLDDRALATVMPDGVGPSEPGGRADLIRG